MGDGRQAGRQGKGDKETRRQGDGRWRQRDRQGGGRQGHRK